jgi:hypothetical protein
MRKGGNTATNMGMKMTLRLVVAATAAAFIWVSPAAAVIGGSPDGNAHPYVGMSVFLESDGTAIQCSGFLVSAKVYVTAGHCAGLEFPGGPTPVAAEVWFSNGPISHGTPPDVFGMPVAAPGWNGVLPDHDIGVVYLEKAMPGPYAPLVHSTGYLDQLTTRRGLRDVSFTTVGYGVVDAGPAGFVPLFTRLDGTVQLQKLTDIDVQTSASPGNGTGGSATCEGDSGGPLFSGGIVVALVSGGRPKFCNGNAIDFRLDTPEAQGFVQAAIAAAGP